MTTYVERARSMYERGDAARAAFMFANGLLRDPDNEDALNWLLMLYVEKIEKPGMERDILRVLETQPDGLELFELIETRLAEQDRANKIEALRRMRDREGFLEEQPVSPVSGSAPDEPNEEQGREKANPEPRRESSSATGQDESSRDTERKNRHWSDGTGSLGEANEDAWREFEDPFDEEEGEKTGEGTSFRRTTATTGVYSSLNAISEEKAKRELREYYARKRKIQVLIGLVIIALVSAVLLYAFPQDDSSSATETNQNVPTEAPE